MGRNSDLGNAANRNCCSWLIVGRLHAGGHAGNQWLAAGAHWWNISSVGVSCVFNQQRASDLAKFTGFTESVNKSFCRAGITLHQVRSGFCTRVGKPSWAGEALGKVGKFPASLCLMAKKLGNADYRVLMKEHMHVCSTMKRPNLGIT